MLFVRRSINAILSEVGCRKESGINSNSLISSPAESTNTRVTYQHEKLTIVVQTVGYIPTVNSITISLQTYCYVSERLCLRRCSGVPVFGALAACCDSRL